VNTEHPRLHRIRCSAKSLCQTRNSCAHKELQFHGVEDGLEALRTATTDDLTPCIRHPLGLRRFAPEHIMASATCLLGVLPIRRQEENR
jgi:hypothetical protein